MGKISLITKARFIKKNFLLFLIMLLLSYFFLLTHSISPIGTIIGGESVYKASVFSLLDGRIDNNNHPLLAKTIWYYFVYMFSAITGTYSPFFYRIGTILFSLGSLFIFYKIARLFFSKLVSFLCVVLLAIDPMFFSFSRLLQLEIPVLFFLLSGMYYFLKYLDKKKLKLFYVSGIFLGLSLAAKLSAILLVPLFPLLFILFSQKEKLSLQKMIRINFLFLLFLFLAFVAGNGIFFFKKINISFIEFVYQLFISQIGGAVNLPGYLHSSAWSWFTIPQILTLYRVPQGGYLQTIVAFINPIISIAALPTLAVFVFIILRKGILKQKKYSFLIAVFFALYFPWFFNMHSTYYYYAIPLIPIIIILFLTLLQKIQTRLRVPLLVLILFASVIIFAVYFPLLTGIKILKSSDLKLTSWSLYKFSNMNTVFCQQCYPRK